VEALESVCLRPRTEEETLHWLALRMTPGIGAKKTVELLERFGSPVPIFRASASELMAWGLPGTIARSIASGCAFDEAIRQHELLKAAGAMMIAYDDPVYPQQLREIFDPPPVLFARGQLPWLNEVMVGVVGSRRATQYGLSVAEKLGADLAAAGIAVVSGMARGIDTAAHHGALTANGGTIAVFGCGVDLVYPAENRKLAARMAERGLLLSEFPMGAPAYPQNFPIRNRIVSGLSAGVLVVEGAQYSGSTITARLALDQSREVFAVPGNITNKMSWGPNQLIKQGAHLVQDAQDVLDALPWTARERLATLRASRASNREEATLPAQMELGPMAPLGQQIISFLCVDCGTSLDTLIDGLTEWSSSEIIAVLFELELAGQVKQLPGKAYMKCW
jgi:DNA processing protein